MLRDYKYMMQLKTSQTCRAIASI